MSATVVAAVAVDDADLVDGFLARIDHPLMHYGTRWLRFLQKALPHATVHALAARRDGHVVGLLPWAVARSDLGVVVNSLPFYGSHGGPIGDAAAVAALVGEFAGVVAAADAASVTVVENPFAPLDDAVAAAAGLAVVDDRVGQVTRLPVGAADVDAALMARFHEKTRNAIRKGRSSGVVVADDDSDDAWRWLHGVHERSIAALGGVAKSLETFFALKDVFGTDARVTVGSVDGVRVAGLLCLHHRDTVEYFTPVIEPAHRTTQALSAVIFDAMKRATLERARLWNWGGTWRSQEGVYRFKSRFGADDVAYRYFHQLRDAAIKDADRAALGAAYRNFYVFKY